MELLGISAVPTGASAAVVLAVAVAVVVAAIGVLPLRGGTGQHAHAGPGTVLVSQLRDDLTTGEPARPVQPAQRQDFTTAEPDATEPDAAEPDTAEPDTEEIIWPEADPPLSVPQQHEPEYVGRHRLIELDVFCQPARAARVQLARNFPRCGLPWA